MTDAAFQRCINPECLTTFAIDDVRVTCDRCGSLLDIAYDWSRISVPKSLSFFEHRWATKGFVNEGRLDFSGVWRFRDIALDHSRKPAIPELLNARDRVDEVAVFVVGRRDTQRPGIQGRLDLNDDEQDGKERRDQDVAGKTVGHLLLNIAGSQGPLEAQAGPM